MWKCFLSYFFDNLLASVSSFWWPFQLGPMLWAIGLAFSLLFLQAQLPPFHLLLSSNYIYIDLLHTVIFSFVFFDSVIFFPLHYHFMRNRLNNTFSNLSHSTTQDSRISIHINKYEFHSWWFLLFYIIYMCIIYIHTDKTYIREIIASVEENFSLLDFKLHLLPNEIHFVM